MRTYDPADIAERIKSTLKQKNISASKMLLSCDINKDALNTMKKGYLPRLEHIAKMADYLDGSIDYFLGRSDPPETAKPLQQMEGDKGIQMYKSLDDIDRAEIRGEMKHMLKAEKYRQPLIVAARSNNHQPPEPRTLTAEQLRILLTEEGLEQDPNCKL